MFQICDFLLHLDLQRFDLSSQCRSGSVYGSGLLPCSHCDLSASFGHGSFEKVCLLREFSEIDHYEEIYTYVVQVLAIQSIAPHPAYSVH